MNFGTMQYDFRLYLKNLKQLREDWQKKDNGITVRIAIMAGSTTAVFSEVLESMLLSKGIRAQFYKSQYNRYYEEVVFDTEGLREFKPDIIYFHTTYRNILNKPDVSSDKFEVERKLSEEYARFCKMWNSALKNNGALIIQNNFEWPEERSMGNLEAFQNAGEVLFATELNSLFLEYANSSEGFYLQDINYLAAKIGLDKWHNKKLWYEYKMAVSYEGLTAIANNMAGMIADLYGRSKKCLVIDLDNTIWGGVVGEDGWENLKLGKETSAGEAYQEFQIYIKKLKQRGVLLAICSKNDMENVVEAFKNPQMILKQDDFVAIKANWELKSENVRKIAEELNIGLDSMVFIDDNPAERKIVSDRLPEVSVPDIGDDVTQYIEKIEDGAWFIPMSFSEEDSLRTDYYKRDSKRYESFRQTENYEEYLESLEMKAVIQPFKHEHIERITQLLNKTNQFNLTGRRYTLKEIKDLHDKENYVTISGRLADRFGDNGLVSVIIAHRDKMEHDFVTIDAWVMSCRVFGRELEFVMFNNFVECLKQSGISKIVGKYLPTKKNTFVKELYASLGFRLVKTGDDNEEIWEVDVISAHSDKGGSIEVLPT